MTTKNTVGKRLKPTHEKFCQLYASEGEFFANGVQSYVEAFGIDASKPESYRSARVKASQLLTKGNICDRIDEILDDKGLNDQFVDKQLLFLIKQNADLSTKRGAIGEYNKVKQRITDKQDTTVTVTIKSQ